MDELEIVQYRKVSGLCVFFNTAAYRSPHFHQDWELLWVLDAPLRVSCMQKICLLQPGDLVLFPPNTTHELRQTEGSCTFLCMQISPAAFPSAAGTTTDDIRLEPYLPKQEYDEIRRTVLDIAAAYIHQTSHYELFCSGTALVLLYRLLTALPCRQVSAEETASVARQNARLLRLVDFVEENYSRKLLLSEFAARENCSVSYLSHFIRDTMNQTFQEYVTSVRLSAACRMMDEGAGSAVSVCAAAGFSDYRYFSRAFRQAFGVTPAQYRKQEHIPVRDQEPQSRSGQSREVLLSRGQSLQLLQKFRSFLPDRDPEYTL